MTAMKGVLVSGNPDSRWSGATIDSRQVAGSELFFALRGEHTDGHRFVDDALLRGAAAAVVDEEISCEGASIRVDDTVAALHALTAAVRRRVPEHLVAITGSAGKTTTKELLAAMLARRFRCAKSPGNLNNLLGFPLSLLAVPENTEWMVAEMGMSTPGELSRLSRLGRPDVAVFTNVRAVHLEFFSDVCGIAEAKAELLEGLSPEGIVVANADDAEVVRIVRRHPGKVVRFGRGREVEHRAHRVESLAGGGTRFTWTQEGREHTVRLGLLGEHNVSNFLAAAASASTLGVPADEIVEVAAAAVPEGRRGAVHRLSQLTLVDDTYNSNPAALEAALDAVGALEGQRHWAVLGDMLELGRSSRELHRRAGRAAASRGFSPVVGVGEATRDLVAAAAEAGSEGLWFETADEAATHVPDMVVAGDALLVKGSRGVGLEIVVQSLLDRWGGD
jgi:UDP-N-acetylmuramoyl-tripeptide--D-alanyl-D-alanine ligase